MMLAIAATTGSMLGTAQADDRLMLEPGLWEVRTTTGTIGMPSDLPPVPVMETICLSQDAIEDESVLPALSGAKGACQMGQLETDEGVTYWKMYCLNFGQQVEAHAEIHPASPEMYVGKVDFKTSGNKPAMSGHITVHGERVGDCASSIRTVQHEAVMPVPN